MENIIVPVEDEKGKISSTSRTAGLPLMEMSVFFTATPHRHVVVVRVKLWTATVNCNANWSQEDRTLAPADGAYVVDIEVQRKISDGECRENVTLMEKSQCWKSIFLIFQMTFMVEQLLFTARPCPWNGQILDSVGNPADQSERWRTRNWRMMLRGRFKSKPYLRLLFICAIPYRYKPNWRFAPNLLK